MNDIFAFALAIGVVAGLRSMMAPTLIAWAARLGWINLQDTAFGWMSSTSVAVIFSLLALGELMGDKLPFAPKRTQPLPLSARIVLGGFCGLCFSAAMHRPLFPAAIVGSFGGFIGAFAGYRIRRWLVRTLHTGDRVIAIAEDLIALGAAILIVSRGVGA
jgi:uncharacterized membrane protein